MYVQLVLEEKLDSQSQNILIIGQMKILYLYYLFIFSKNFLGEKE